MPMPKGGAGGNTQGSGSDMIDKDISFEKRDMHKTWPFVQGCLLLMAGVAGFIYLSMYVFRNWSSWSS